MNKLKSLFAGILAFSFLLSSSVGVFAAEDLKLDIEEAVKLGIENSIQLDKVEKEIQLSDLSKRRAKYSAKKLRRGKDDLRDAANEISKAQNLLDKNIAPTDIDVGGNTISAGTDLSKLPDSQQEAIKKGIQKSLDDSKKQITSGDYKIINSLQEAGKTISSKLDFASLESLTVESTSDVLETMANITYEVSQASFDIYKNSIALLIQKNYYDVLKAEQLLDVRQKAMERAKTQYEFSKASYEEGIKAKDDMLISNIYYKTTKIQYEDAKGKLENAIVELKKSINIDFEKEVELTDILLEESQGFDLDIGLVNGMKNRIEMKKALGEVAIYSLNFEETKRKYTPNTFQYQEAEILRDKSAIDFDEAKLEVENSIRKSYNSTNTVSKMLEETKEMVEEAEENLEIAKLKYKEGFGVETSLLQNLNLEDSAGTIVEVLAAEEKLAEIEENVVNIIYTYNLARMQYLNNTGDFIY
jgi:outer membrane protein TolC